MQASAIINPPASMFDKCKVCGSPDLLREAPELGLVRCPACKFVFAERSYTPEELTQLYGELYTPGGEYDMHLKQSDDLRTRGTTRIGFDRETVLNTLLEYHPNS